MLSARRWRQPVVVYVALPTFGIFIAGMVLAGVVGDRVITSIATAVTLGAILGFARWTVRNGDVFETRSRWRAGEPVTMTDPEVVIRPVSSGRDVVTVISVVDGGDDGGDGHGTDTTRRIDVARFRPLTGGITLRRARRTARALGARFDEDEWRDWLSSRRRPPTRRP